MNNEERKEEKKRKGVKELVDGKMDEYGVTKRSIYSIIGITGCLALTLVWSIVGTNFDPAVFASWGYWVAIIIQFAISIFSMVTGRQIGDDVGRNNKNGQYKIELKEYENQYNHIDKINMFEHFEPWLVSSYRERKVEEKIKEALRDFGIKQPEVLDLDWEDIEKLNKPFRKSWLGTPFEGKYPNNETIFLSLDEEQIQALKAIKKGAIKVPYVSASYFMNALKGTSVDEWDRAAKSDKKKGAKLASGYSYRIVLMLVISVALNGIVPVPYEEMAAASVAINIAQRVFTLISSTIWGFYLGMKVVDMDIIFLAYKTLVLKTYVSECESGAYKPESIAEKAKRQYNEYEEEKKKAADSVVTPEVMGEIGGPVLIGGGANV